MEQISVLKLDRKTEIINKERTVSYMRESECIMQP
jgi:hypothetical protein